MEIIKCPQIKFFKGNDLTEIEMELNDFLDKDNVEFIDIKTNFGLYENIDDYYYIILIYNEVL